MAVFFVNSECFLLLFTKSTQTKVGRDKDDILPQELLRTERGRGSFQVPAVMQKHQYW